MGSAFGDGQVRHEVVRDGAVPVFFAVRGEESALLLEGEAIGGQAGSSSLIRNYLGFPRGISGAGLATRAWAHPGSAAKVRNAPAFPQVTGSDSCHTKIVRVFELMPLNSALDRIRTCAHGFGEGCCARP